MSDCELGDTDGLVYVLIFKKIFQGPRLRFRNENELCPTLLTVKQRDSGGLDFSKIWEFAFESDSVFQIVGVSVW